MCGFHDFQAWGRFRILAGGVFLIDFIYKSFSNIRFHDFQAWGRFRIWAGGVFLIDVLYASFLSIRIF